MTDTLPDGFVLDQQPSAPLPEGFVADPAPHKFGLGDTWPAQLAKNLWSAFTLPGDVMAGKTQLPSSQGEVPGSVPATPGNDDAMARTRQLALFGNPVSAATRAGEGIFGVPITPPAAAIPAATTAADTAANLGAPLPKGLASPNPAIQAVTQAARALPLVGAKIDKAASNTVNAAGEAVNNLATDLSGGVTDRASAGAILRPSLQGVIDNNNGKIGESFNSLRGMLDQSEPTELPQTSAVLKDILKQRVSAGQVNPQAGLEDIANLTKSGSTFDGLQRARSDIGNQIKFGQANPGFNGGDLKRIYGAMSGDMDTVVRNSAASGVDAEQASAALKQANATAAPLIEQNGKLQRLTSAGNTNENVAGQLVNALQNKKGNVQLLAQLKNSMPPEDFNNISGVALSELGHNTATNKFSLNQFATNWNSLGPQAKNVMFTPQHQKFLDDVANLGFHLKNAEQYANRSQTALGTGLRGAVTTGAGALGMLAYQGNIMPTIEAALAAGGGYGLATLLSRPATAATVARWSRAALAYDSTPTVATRATLKVANDNVAKALNLPTTGAMPAAANQQQQQ